MTEIATALYRHFDANGSLLYVGRTADFSVRTAEHQRIADWWPLVRCTSIDWMDADAAVAAETLAIQTERPSHNDIHRPKADRILAQMPATRGASQTTPAEWKRLADAGYSPTEAASITGKTPAAARKVASIYGFKFRDARKSSTTTTTEARA